jgi:hypothetical protein
MHKWYVKLFGRLLKPTVLNAMTIYRHNAGKQIHQLAFSVSLVKALFKQFADTERKYIRQHKISFHDCRKDISSKKVPSSGKNSTPQKRCWVCTKHEQRKDTRFCCVLRDVGLCLEEWFEA